MGLYEGGGSRSKKRYRQTLLASKNNTGFNDETKVIDRHKRKSNSERHRKYTSPTFGGENKKKEFRYNSLRLARGTKKPNLPK